MCIGFCSERSSYELKLFEVILLHAQEFSIKNYWSSQKTSYRLIFLPKDTPGSDVCIGFCSELSSYELNLCGVILLQAQDFSIINYCNSQKTSQNV